MSKIKLSILVPQYHETNEVIKPLLDSIAIQRNTDFANDIEVIIVNDGSDVFLTEEFLSTYNFPIHYFKESHRGVSGTRNACLDHARGRYVMWCDADDQFYHSCAFYILFNEIQLEVDGKEQMDGLVSLFVEESRNPTTGEILYLNRDRDSTFVHGKMYRRKYLLDNKIRWNDDLIVHEDSYFNCLCRALSMKIKYYPISFYLWCWRKESVCRHDPLYILKTYPNMLKSNSALIHELIRRGKIDQARSYVCNMIFDGYYMLNGEQWLDIKNKDYRDKVERCLAWYYKEFKKFFEECPQEIRNQIIIGIKNRTFNEGIIFEDVTYKDWIKKIEELEPLEPFSYDYRDEEEVCEVSEETI